jgi:hypothetical protein
VQLRIVVIGRVVCRRAVDRWAGNPIALAGPVAEVEELTAIRAERPE